MEKLALGWQYVRAKALFGESDEAIGSFCIQRAHRRLGKYIQFDSTVAARNYLLSDLGRAPGGSRTCSNLEKRTRNIIERISVCRRARRLDPILYLPHAIW